MAPSEQGFQTAEQEMVSCDDPASFRVCLVPVLWYGDDMIFFSTAINAIAGMFFDYISK